jgi:hypothetical protein
LAGRLQEAGINHIDYETCNDLYNGDIVYSVMLCAGSPSSCEGNCQGDFGGSVFDRKSTKSDGLQAVE